MKISNSKKQLAKIIHENGGWRDGEFAAQDGDGGVGGYGVKPEWNSQAKYWWREALDEWFSVNKINNHHQTILSRDEYFHLYPVAETAPEPVVEAKPTIEQLAADYRNSKNYAERKQQEADAAKADAEAKLAELVAAGEALGLALSVVGAESKPELAIIDWRDLQVDDLIWYAGDDELSYGEYRVMGIENPDYEGYRTVLVNGGNGGHWIDIRAGWGFIRRP